MFEWNREYLWNFDDAGLSSQDSGPQIPGANVFRFDPVTNLVREIAQNSGDARDCSLPDDVPVEIVFEVIDVDPSDLPDMGKLSSVIDMCHAFMSNKEGAKLDDINILSEANEKYLKTGARIPVLKVSDYNTHGLRKKDFEALLNSDGITFKTEGDSAGSFGYGKTAPFLASPVNTILYASLSDEDEFRFEARTYVSTYMDEETHRKKMGNGVFGCIGEVDGQMKMCPVMNQSHVPEVFRREKTGTDLFILCFERTEDWMDRMAISALENFFMAIHYNKLKLVFKDGNNTVELRSDNLDEKIEEYSALHMEKYGNELSGIKFTAPVYWHVFKNTEPVVVSDFRKKGKVELYILMGEEIKNRGVLEMRSSLMKIQEDSDFRGLPPFNGLLIASGDGKNSDDYNSNISAFLKETEPPTHNSWRVEDVTKDALKHEAKLVIEGLHKLIRDTVKAQLPEDDGTSVEAFGMSDILPDVTEEGSHTIEEENFLSFKPVMVAPKKTSVTRKRAKKQKGNGRGHNTNPNPEPEPTPRPNPGNDHPNNRQRKKVYAPVRLRTVRTPYIKDSDSYRITLSSESDADPMYLEISVSGDDGTYETSVIGAEKDGKRLAISGKYVVLPKIKKKEKTTLEIKLDEQEICALEVNAYVKK